MTDDVQIDLTDHVLTVRLNRPAKRNALTREMYTRIAEALDAAKTNDAVRTALLLGTAQCFTAGNDLEDPMIQGLDGAHGKFMRALMGFPKPLVAAPCGVAVGVGVTMLLHCDLVYGGDSTTFRIPFVQLGVCPEFGSSWTLPRLLGHQRASAILLAGEPFDARSAMEFGIVNQTLANAEVEAFARDKARGLAALPPLAMRTTKMLMKRAHNGAALDAIDVEMEHLVRLQHGAEAREAIAAFVEKRRPNFTVTS